MRRILTDALCRTKPPRSGRLEIADLRQAGLVLRITSNGARSFAYRFRHPHSRKTLRATIGPYPATTLEAARKRAKDMAAQVADGTNPIELRSAEREAAPARTFEALAARYLKEHAERHKRPRSAEEDRRNLAVHVLPKWSERDFRWLMDDETTKWYPSVRVFLQKRTGEWSEVVDRVRATLNTRAGSALADEGRRFGPAS